MSKFESYEFYTKFTQESEAYVNAIPESWTWDDVANIVPEEQKQSFQLSSNLAQEWLTTITPSTLWRDVLKKFHTGDHPNDFDHMLCSISQLPLQMEDNYSIVVTDEMITQYKQNKSFTLEPFKIKFPEWWSNPLEVKNFKPYVIGFFVGTLWQYTQPHKRKYNRARNVFCRELKNAKEKIYAIESNKRKEEKQKLYLEQKQREGKENQARAEAINATLPTLKHSIETSLTDYKVTHTLHNYFASTWMHLLGCLEVVQYTTVDSAPFVELMELIEKEAFRIYTPQMVEKLQRKRMSVLEGTYDNNMHSMML